MIDSSDFMSPDAPLPTTLLVRRPFGIDWLDRMTGGGMADGDAMLFVSPSGGGGTVFGTQITWARARLFKHACYLSYEQLIETDVATDIMSRFYAMATRRPKSFFTSGSHLQTLPPDVLALLQEARQRYGKYSHVYDMSRGDRGSGGVEEIREIIATETRKGRRPELVVVDWVQVAVGRYMAAKQIVDADGEITRQMDIFARDFARLCRDEKLNGVLLQQRRTDDSSSFGEPMHLLAAYCRSLGHYCRFAFGVSRMTKSGFGKLVRSKATSVDSSYGDELLVRLRGDLNEFVDATRDVIYDDRSGEFVPRESVRTDRVGEM
jgi:hypothetical protein